MNRFTFGGIILVLAICLSGCSRKKDKFVNRSWHAITTEYNTLYNGDLALDIGKRQIAENYYDNFWELLPVERLQVSNEIMLAGTIKNENFKIAEEKAAKAIQRHSMFINGKEKNPQIDEAYLMLGKARYYDQRFLPALEAFNYILHRYPASNTIHHAQIWREKTHIRLENEKLAIKNLKKIIDNGHMAAQDFADAHAMLAQAYINTGVLDSAVAPIKLAAMNTRVNDEKGRYHYIEGQLYKLLEKRDSANIAFKKVVDLNRKIPREYLVNAQLEKARNFNYDNGDTMALLEYLRELEEDRENRPFLDKIYFQVGEFYHHLDSTALAIENYNRSLKVAENDDFLRSVNYETLGNIYFDKTNYRTAGAYYDSTLVHIPPTTRDYFVIKRKRENLQEVIMYEEIAEKNDSILRLVAMNEEERLAFFTEYTNELKAQAIKKAKEGEVEANVPAEPVRRSPGAPPALGGPNPGTTFYFYNPGRVANGMNDFLRTWGPRNLKDNWRTNPGNIASTENEPRELDEVSELIIANNPRFNAQLYIDKIPAEARIIDSLAAQRNDSYYRLGLIYKEKFNEKELALEKLEDLLKFTSEERLVVPASYYLYQIYTEIGEVTLAAKYKNYLLKEHPKSRYAVNILNPGKALAGEKTPNQTYKELYSLFEEGEYQIVLELGAIEIDKLRGDELLPKIELLVAMAKGRLLGFEPYKKALNEIAVNYPQTEEGRKAQQLYNTALPKLADKSFNGNELQAKVKMLLKFELSEKALATRVKKKIDSTLTEVKYKNYTTSLDIYNQNTIFVMVHGFENLSRAEGFAELLQANDMEGIREEPVFISSENYRVVQLHKNLESYIEFKNNN